MSGHSKWANIKRTKQANDSKRSQVFSKMSRAITIGAKMGGGDVDSNPTLRLAVEKAKEARMPKENIDKAIKKGTGESKDSESFSEVTYEGFGPNGEAFFVKGITDNKNRTAAEIRSIFSKHGGSLGGPGSTSYIFMPDPENPSYSMEITSDTQKKALLKILEELDESDDIQDVYFNFDMDFE